MVLVLISTELIWNYKHRLFFRKLFIVAVLNGLVFSLMNDTGIYAFVATIGLFIIDDAIKTCLGKTTVKKLITYGVGFLMGIIPYCLYLFLNGSLGIFIHSLLELSELQQLAKTPFLHGFVSVDNLFTISILFISISWVCYLLYKGIKLKLINYIEIALMFVLIILEQKSIWRHIDSQLTFIGFILGSVLTIEAANSNKTFKYIIISIYILITLSILFVFPFTKININQGPYTCVSRFEIQDQDYLSVKNILQKEPGFNGKIFSYPGDTMFYVLFKQKPPYYPTSFEAGSYNAQQKLIRYIKYSNIDYVIYNYENQAIQDGVPNYIRSSYLHTYILTNYVPYKIVNRFLILKKKKEDFFDNKKLLNQIPAFEKYLFNVDLADIPRSEGYYKFNKLNEFKLKQVSVGAKFNKALPSINLFLVVSYKNSEEKLGRRILITANGAIVNVSFDNCSEDSKCIIDISKLPYFYKNRPISEVSMKDVGDIKSIQYVYIPPGSEFW
ncbi:MAG TPA: hypothetical protein VHE53_01140 [Patescibacteria group bacterium]|nr:hypothetical protein [Patescibacteria group bacterium]